MKSKDLIKKSILSFFTIVLAITFYTCDYSYFDIDELNYTYSPEFAFPAIKSTITVKDIVDFDTLDIAYVDDDNVICFVYSAQSFSLEASELFFISNQVLDFSHTFSPLKSGSNSKDEISEVFRFYYDGQERIDTITLNSGKLITDIHADELVQDGFDLMLELEIPDSYNELGEEFRREFLLSETPVEHDLAGYTLVFDTNDDGDNFFDIEYVISIHEYGNPINHPYELNFVKNINDIRYHKLVGYIDNFDFSTGYESIGLGFFSESDLSDVFFKNPSLIVFADNTLGLPIDIHFDRFVFYNEKGDTVSIRENDSDAIIPWRIAAPEIPGETAFSKKTFNRDNTNIDELLAIAPSNLNFHTRGETNPDMDTDVTNFIYHDSRLSVGAELNLPLDGNVKDFRFQDTIDFPLNGIENIEWLEMKLVVDNGFPISLGLQLHFLDSLYNELDVLFLDDYENIFDAAAVDPEGDVVGSTTKETIIDISEEIVQNIHDAKYVILSFSFNTQDESSDSSKGKSDSFSVKIRDTYTIGVETFVRVKLAMKL